jgi:hypothetical protein
MLHARTGPVGEHEQNSRAGRPHEDARDGRLTPFDAAYADLPLHHASLLSRRLCRHALAVVVPGYGAAIARQGYHARQNLSPCADRQKAV